MVYRGAGELWLRGGGGATPPPTSGAPSPSVQLPSNPPHPAPEAPVPHAGILPGAGAEEASVFSVGPSAPPDSGSPEQLGCRPGALFRVVPSGQKVGL